MVVLVPNQNQLFTGLGFDILFRPILKVLKANRLQRGVDDALSYVKAGTPLRQGSEGQVSPATTTS